MRDSFLEPRGDADVRVRRVLEATDERVLVLVERARVALEPQRTGRDREAVGEMVLEVDVREERLIVDRPEEERHRPEVALVEIALQAQRRDLRQLILQNS